MNSESSLLRSYYEKYYPWDSIIKMLKMTRSTSLLQYRDIGLQPDQNAGFQMKKKFNRVLDDGLKEEVMKSNIYALHMGSFRPLSMIEYYYPGQQDDGFSSSTQPIIYDKYCLTSVLPNIEVSKPLKEMVFDIDITDYDRFCQSCEKSICNHCWLHIEGTYIILKDLLLNRYGIKDDHIMWIFSGGKGIHCFINDPVMIKMTEKSRLNIYFDIKVDKGNDYIQHTQKYNQSFYSQLLIRKLTLLFKNKVLLERNLLFTSQSFQDHVLNKIKSHYPSSLYSLIQSTWSKIDTSTSMDEKDKSIEKWRFLCNIESNTQKQVLKPSIYIILSLYYPMIDKEPMKLTHLIKLPFSVHTSTKKISLPINECVMMNYKAIESFIQLQHGPKIKSNPLFDEGKVILDEWISHYVF